ncbi:MAG: glucose-6-phosphate isomerase [Desulfobulbaceae bacterium]|jgi:glucose-6-phosphate isomerase|nr:glucose-6-phosphate isomerase [Desulfobulbaceae bacterium]
MLFREFNDLSSVRRLRQLAETPYDLTRPGALDGERLQNYRAATGGFDYLYATQRLDEQTLDSLQDLADEAGLVEQFIAMKSGEVMNRIEGFDSENRPVLHTACRDIFSDAPRHPGATEQAREQLARLRRFLDDLDRGRIVNHRGETFTTMVQVGIGGSDLGPRALYIALERYRLPGRSARFIANVDPDDAAAVLSSIDLSRTLFNVVSKSGSTLETLTNERLVKAALRDAGLDPARHLLAVTGVGSPMDNPRDYLASFHMYDYIGGRYSATSMVGGVTLGFALGHDVFVEILKGAHAVDVAAEERSIRANVPLLMALTGIWNRCFLGHQTLAVLPYSQALLRFPAHLQQCDMESNGKSISRNGIPVSWPTGPIVWGEPGTNGQHAFYQLLHQGTTTVPAEFIGFRRSQYGRDITVDNTSSQEKLVANMLAQSMALATGREHANPNKRFAGNRPSSVLIGDRLTPASMGALLALYESKIVFQGFCWNINSFDQEGVQLGKVLAGRLLDVLAAARENGSKNLDGKSLEYALLTASGCLNPTRK